MRRALGPWGLVIIACSGLVAVFLLLPMLVILPLSFSSGEFLDFPPPGLSTRWYRAFLDDPAWRSALGRSVLIALGAAAIATAGGTAAALAVRRVRPRPAAWLRMLFIAPMVLPYVVYALGLYNLLDALRLSGPIWPVMLGQAVLALPVVFVVVSGGLAGVDPALVRASASLGASWPVTVRRVELPLVRPTIVAAGVFAFAFCLDEVVVALFLSEPGKETLPVAIFGAIRDTASPVVAAASTLIMLVALALMLGAGALARRKGAPS